MEQLWVAYLIDEQGHVAYAYRHPTDAEVLAYAATLPGAEVVKVERNRHNNEAAIALDPGRYLVIPLHDKETTHACPPGDSGVTPCCGRTPFELPHSDRLTSDLSLVTCLPDKETTDEG